jgi:hypothetical protein
MADEREKQEINKKIAPKNGASPSDWGSFFSFPTHPTHKKNSPRVYFSDSGNLSTSPESLATFILAQGCLVSTLTFFTFLG